MESLSLGFTGVIFFIVVGIKPTYLISCGTLNFENPTVMECQTARLIYTPNKEQAHEMRQWVREINLTFKTIYDFKTLKDESKYFESKQGESYILSISAVNSADAGDYLVHCGGGHYTRQSKLDVSVNTNDCLERCGILTTTNSYVIEGDPFTFHFSVHPGKDITWEKKVETTYTQLKDQKYSIRVLQEKRVHSLHILETEYSNSGEYRVNCGDTVSNSIYLNIVYSPPSNPVFSNNVSKFYCNNQECILATLNKSVTVECYVEGGSKPIEINMFKNGVKLMNTSKVSDDRIKITYNYIRYSFIPTMSDINAMLKCTVNNPAIQEPLETSLMLYTAVPPKSIEVNGIEVVEREQAVIQCITKNCRPPLMSDLSIGIEKPNTTTKVEKAPDNLYTITTSTTQIFTRTQNQDKVLCCSNIGETRCETKNINVLFPPKNVTVEEIFKHNDENGDTMMTLKFIVAESNPRSSINLSGLKHVKRMLVDKRNDPESETYGLIFTEIWSFNFKKDDDKREIKCDVQNDGFPDLELSCIYTLNITYYPIVMISEKEFKTVYLGEDVDLTCDVDSNPLSTLSWHNHTGVIIIDEIFGAKRIDLHLRNVSIDHSQTYSCKAHNGIGGIVTRNISLIVKDPSERPVTISIKPSAESNIATFLGPVVGLLFAILIAVIVALIIRTKRQNEPLNKRNIHEIKIEKRKPSLHPTRNDTEMQAGYESLAGQDTTTEIEMYTDLDTEMQGGYESLAGQGTTTEIEMYTNLDDDMQARYESLAGQDTTTEKEMYTHLDTEMHPAYESLAGQGYTSEIEMYTNLAESQTTTEILAEYDDSEL